MYSQEVKKRHAYPLFNIFERYIIVTYLGLADYGYSRREFSSTHAYAHWLADVHFGSFAPALATLIFNSLCRSKTANAPANRQIPIASVVRLRKN
jgi:hypothetical protein